MKLSIIIPALNEEKSIPLVLKGLYDSCSEFIHEIIVVNNGSIDKTKEVSENEGAIVIDQPIKGYGIACLTGIAHALKSNIDYVAFVDGDYSDNPENLIDLINKIKEGYDLVIGSRVIKNDAKKALFPQARFGNWLSTKLMKLFFGGYPFTDLGPFRIIKTDSLIKLNMNDQDFGWTVEMQAKALMMNMKCTEIPVDYKERIGTSKVSGTIKGSILAGHKILLTIFSLYIRQKFSNLKNLKLI